MKGTFLVSGKDGDDFVDVSLLPNVVQTYFNLEPTLEYAEFRFGNPKNETVSYRKVSK